jgi:hypothetical protein
MDNERSFSETRAEEKREIAVAVKGSPIHDDGSFYMRSKSPAEKIDYGRYPDQDRVRPILLAVDGHERHAPPGLVLLSDLIGEEPAPLTAVLARICRIGEFDCLEAGFFRVADEFLAVILLEFHGGDFWVRPTTMYQDGTRIRIFDQQHVVFHLTKGSESLLFYKLERLLSR